MKDKISLGTKWQEESKYTQNNNSILERVAIANCALLIATAASDHSLLTYIPSS